MPEAIVQPSCEIWNRHDFCDLCNWRKLWRAAEIGVDRGNFAAQFLSRWIGHEYWAVDDYLPHAEFDYDREADFLMAVEALKPHRERAKLLRGRSIDMAPMFGPASLDFLYIDGAHDYQSVISDIRAWWHTLSPQGILAGHDWTDQPNHAGVKPAVMEFAAEIGQTIYITAVEPYQIETCPSFYIYKSGMPGPEWRRC